MPYFDSEFFFAPEAYRSDRLLLRPLRPGDGPLYAAARNISFAHCGRFRRWTEETMSEQACEKWVRTAYTRYLANEEFYLGVFAPDGQELWGESHYFLRMGNGLAVRSAAMGMWIRGDRAGQGLGTAAIRAMLGWGFSEWPWDRLAWHCDHRNIASRKAAQKAGMRQEGVMRAFLWYPDGPKQDMINFSALRDEWSGDAD